MKADNEPLLRERRPFFRTALVVLAILPIAARADERRPIQNLQITEFGLEMANERATGEAWTLDRSTNYASSDEQDFRNEIQAVLRLALRQQDTAKRMLPLDINLDGNADWWAFYSAGVPVFLETDRFGTGCHDLRVDLRNNGLNVEEFHGWATKPPIQVAFDITLPINFHDIYDWAGRCGLGEPNDWKLTKANLHAFPNAKQDIQQLAARSDPSLAEQLDLLAQQGQSLVARFTQVHRQMGFSNSLVHGNRTQLQHLPYDLDRKPGKEVAVVFATWGVFSVRFFPNDWITDKAPLAEVFFSGTQAVQLQLGQAQFFRVQGHWLRVSTSARKEIAQKSLAPGYSEFRQHNFYTAIYLWERGVALAGLIGDLQPNANGALTGPVSTHVGDRWEFEAATLSAFSLLKVADDIARAHAVPSFSDFAEQLRQRDEFAQALALFNLELAFARKDRNAISEANALDGLAAIYRRLGNYDRAIESLFKSLDIESSLAYSSGIVKNLRNLSQDGDQTAAYRALQMRSHAMNVNRTCKLATLAALFLELDETAKGTGYLEEAERLNERLGNLYVGADLLTIRARLDFHNRQWDLVEQRLKRAIELVDKAVQHQTSDEFGKDRFAAGYALHQFRVDFPRGFDLIDMKTPTHPLAVKSTIAGMLVELYLTRASQSPNNNAEHYKLASSWEQRAFVWAEQANDDDGVINSRFRKAAIAAGLGSHEEATSLLSQVIAESRERELFETLWRALLLDSAIHEQLEDVSTAISQLERAASEIESLRTRIHSEPARRGFFGSKANVYERLAMLYLRQRDAAGSGSQEFDHKVWQCMERAKARTLLDMVGGEDLQIRGVDVLEAREASRKFGDPLASLGSQRTDDSRSTAIADFTTSLAGRPQLQEVASLSTIQPTRLADLQAILDEGELLVEYFQTDAALLAAVISQDRLQVVRLDGMTRDRVNSHALHFRELLQNPQSDYEASAKQLYTLVLAPCFRGQRGLKRICVVPTGPLHYVPFAAFVLPSGEFLAERLEVSYAASASALVYSSARNSAIPQSPGKTLVIANPRPHSDFDGLPFAESEGRAVAKIAPNSKLLASVDAVESSIVGELPSCQIFHFAGHTHLQPHSPLQAALMCTEDLQDDGRLEVRELFGMDLSSCKLAVLSACETRLGQLSRGDEIVGLERAFLRAGVPTVVASLWKVDDAATQALMVSFYRNLFEKKLGRADALRQAQLSLLRGGLSAEIDLVNRGLGEATQLPSTITVQNRAEASKSSVRHPRYWASFVLSGQPD